MIGPLTDASRTDLNVKARDSSIYQKSRHTFARFAIVLVNSRNGKDNREIRQNVTADKMFGSIKDPIAIFLNGLGGHGVDIGTGARLCDGKTFCFLCANTRVKVANNLVSSTSQQQFRGAPSESVECMTDLAVFPF